MVAVTLKKMALLSAPPGWSSCAVFLLLLGLFDCGLCAGRPWPLVPWPQSVTWADSLPLTPVSKDLKLEISGPAPASSVLEKAWSHIRSTIFYRDWPTGDMFSGKRAGSQRFLGSPLESVHVSFTAPNSVLSALTNESYRLEVRTLACTLHLCDGMIAASSYSHRNIV